MEKQELIQRIDVLEKEIADLKEINKNNKTWLALLSHDFKGVFANLIWVLNLYNSKSISPEMLVEMFPELENNAQKNLKALDDTFLAAKIQYDSVLTKNEVINLKGLYDEIADWFSGAISKKELSIEFVGNNETTIESNRLIVKSILIKLIDNSIKYSFRGNKIIFSVDSFNNNSTHITIEDFGTGMDDYTFSKLFSLNGAAIAGTEGEKGTGLGLVLVKEALRLINGTIDIISTKDKGTLIDIIL